MNNDLAEAALDKIQKQATEIDRLCANIARLESLLLAAAPDVAKRAGVGTSGAQDEIRAGLATVGPYGGDVSSIFIRAGAERAAAELKKNTKNGPASNAIRKALQGGSATLGDGNAV